MKVTIEMTPEEYQQFQALQNKQQLPKPHWYGNWWGINNNAHKPITYRMPNPYLINVSKIV